MKQTLQMKTKLIIVVLLNVSLTFSWDISLKISQEFHDVSAGEPFIIQPTVKVYRKNGKSIRTDFVGYVLASLDHSVHKLGIFKNNSCLETNRTSNGDFIVETRAIVSRGVANFHGMCVNKINDHYRIQYSLKDEYDIILSEAYGRDFAVSIGSAYRLGILNQPVDAVAGIPWLDQPILSIQDKGGNTVPDDWNGTVLVELVSDKFLPETLTCADICSGFNVSFKYGLATFKGLYVLKAAKYRLKFSTDVLLPDGQSVLSDLFNVEIGRARGLVLVQEPGNEINYGGKSFVRQPHLKVVDVGGNLVVSDSLSLISVSIYSNPSGGTLFSYTNLITPVKFGIAQFKHLSIDKAGEGYSLLYSYINRHQGNTKDTQISAIGNKFTVKVGSPHRLLLLSKPSKVWAGNQPFISQPRLALVDAGGNLLVDDSSTVVTALLVPSLAHNSHIIIDTSSSPIPQIVKVAFDERVLLDTRAVFTTGDSLGVFAVFNEEVTVSSKCTHDVTCRRPFIAFNCLNAENVNIITPAYLSDMYLNSTSRQLLFVYEVHSGQDCISLAFPSNNTTIEVSDFSITDAWGRDVSLKLPDEGNSQNQLNIKIVRIDTSPAIIRSVFLYPCCGNYGAGQELLFQIEFNRRVSVFGTPLVPLNIRSTIIVIDTLQLGSSLSMSYFFIRVGSLISRAITWKDSALDLSRKIRNMFEKDLRICVSRSYSLVENRGYRWAIRFDSLMHQELFPLVATPIPHESQGLVVNVSYVDVDRPFETWYTDSGDEFMCTKRYASYHSGSGTETLSFSYTVQPGDSAHGLDILSSESMVFSSQNDRICNFAMPYENCLATINGSLLNITLTNESPTTVDTSAPYIIDITLSSSSKPNTTYNGGDSLMFDVYFNSAVVVKSDLTLILNVGRIDNYASYVSGSGTTIVTLEYIVKEGHYAAIVDFRGTNSLLLPPNAYVRRLSTTPTTDASLVIPTNAAYFSRHGICVNGLPPKIKSVSIQHDSPGNILRENDDIFFVVQFTDNVTVLTESLIFLLDVGGREREALYVSGNHSNQLTFAYTVMVGDDTSSSTSFNCRKLKTYDEKFVIPVYQYSSNPIVLVDPTISDVCDFRSSGLVIYTRNATVAKALRGEIFQPTAGVYSIGEEVKARVVFSDRVFCKDSHPLLHLITGSSMLYESGCGSNQLIFRHVAGYNDITASMQIHRHQSYDSPIICDSPCSLIDGNGMKVDTTSLTVSIPAASGISIDAEVPIPLLVYTKDYDGVVACPLTAGDEILIYVKFSYPVTVQGEGIYFKVGNSIDSYAIYQSNESNSTDIAFLYFIGHGCIFDIDCPARNGSIILLHGEWGSETYIRRQATYPYIDAALRLPETCVLYRDMTRCRTIDSIAVPRVVRIYCNNATGVYSPGDELQIIIKWSHSVHVKGFPTLLLDTGERLPGIAIHLSGSDSTELVFMYSVSPYQNTKALDVIDSEALNLDRGGIFRTSRNPTILVDKTLPVSGDPRSLSANSDIAVDSRVPYITSIWSPLKSGLYSDVDTIIIVAEFSRPVIVSGYPSLNLALGTSPSREATFVFQPTTSSLQFEYKIHLGDMSLRLDYWTDPKFKVPSSLKLNGGSIKLRSTRPIVDADIHLNPGAGYLSGKVEQRVDNGIVDFEDLAIGSRGLGYKVIFSATVDNVTVEATTDIEVDSSCEYELISNMKERNDNDFFGQSTSVSNEVVAVGAPYAMNPAPDVQVISFIVDNLSGEGDCVQVVETKMISNDTTLQIETFHLTAFAGERIDGSMSIGYYDVQNYTIGVPVTVPVDIDPSYLSVLLEDKYPFLEPISVSRMVNHSCMCQNGWSWTISYHDASYGYGVFRAFGISLTGMGSRMSDTSIVQAAHLITGSFQIHSQSKKLRTRLIPFDATDGDVASVLKNDMGLDVISAHAINTNLQDKPDLGRRWTIVYSTGSDETCVKDFDADGYQLGIGASVFSYAVANGRIPFGGSFALSMLDSNVSNYIPYNATSDQVKEAIESLDSIQRVSVSSKQDVTSDQKISFTWTITFSSVDRKPSHKWVPNSEFHGALPLLNVQSEKLVGEGLSVRVEYLFTEITSTGRESGRVTIFRKVWDIWQLEASLSAIDHEAYDHFGYSVSILTDFLIVGSPSKRGGAAYIFQRSSLCAFCMNVWTEIRKLNTLDACDRASESSQFGYSVLLRESQCGNMLAVIGSPGFDNDSGKVYVFDYRSQEWGFHSSLTSQKWFEPKIGDRFGQVLDFNSNTLVAGSPGYENQHGAVFIFQHMEYCQEFLPSQVIYGPNGIQSGDMFGFSLAIYFHDLVICAPYHHHHGKDQLYDIPAKTGSCYVYRRMDYYRDFLLFQDLLGSSLKANDRFGYSVALSSNKLIIGQVEDFLGSLTTPYPVLIIRTYSHSASNERMLGGFFQLSWKLGSSVSRLISSSSSASSLRHTIEEDLLTGTVNVIRTEADIYGGYTWSVTFKAFGVSEETFPPLSCRVDHMTGPDPACSVTILNNISKNIRGKVHAFTLESGTWEEQAYLFPRLPQRQDLFGMSVSLDGDVAVIGSPNRELMNINSGSAIIFDLAFADIRFARSSYFVNEGERFFVELQREKANKPLIFGVRSVDRNALEDFQTYVNQLFSFRYGEIFPMKYTVVDLLERNTAFGRAQYYGSGENRSQWVDGIFDYRGISDYNSVELKLYIDSSRKSASVLVETTNDKIFEAPDENFSLHVSLPGMFASPLGKLHSSIMIKDDGDGMSVTEVHYRKVFGSKTITGDHMGSVIVTERVSGIILVGGSRRSSEGAGIVYVYGKKGPFWEEEAVLTPSNETNSSSFGRSICVDRIRDANDRLSVMVGSPEQVRAYIFVRSNVHAIWKEEIVLMPPVDSYVTQEHMFADLGAIALDGDVAFVGAARLNAVFVYRRRSYDNATDLYHWTLWNILERASKSSLMNSAAAEHFGAYVTASRRLLLVGAPREHGGRVYAFYSHPHIQRISFIFASEPQNGTLKLLQNEELHMTTKLENSMFFPLSLLSKAEEIKSYIETYLNLGDVSVLVRMQNSSGYGIVWEITFWDIFNDENHLLIPTWKGNGCDDCEYFDSIHDNNHLSLRVSSETRQNITFYKPEDVLIPRDSSVYDRFGQAIALDGNVALVGAPYSSANPRTTWDFETGDLIGWSLSGTSFDSQPILSTLHHHLADRPFQELYHTRRMSAKGYFYIDTLFGYRNNSSHSLNIQGNSPIGTLTSDPFKIVSETISFLIGGGCDHLTTYAELLVDGIPTLRATGRCDDTMLQTVWDVHEYKNRSGQIKVVDEASTVWGHIQVDDFKFDSQNMNINHTDFCDDVGNDQSTHFDCTFEQGVGETPMSGAAYMFHRTCDVDGVCSWTEQVRLVASDKRAGDHFGSSVALDYIEGLAIVGSPSSASMGLFKEIPSVYPHLNTSYIQFPLIPRAETFMKSGYTHSPLQGHLRAINHYLYKNNSEIERSTPSLFNQECGSVYVFYSKNTESVSPTEFSRWATTEDAKFSPPDVFAGDMFGFSIGLHKSYLAVGAVGNDDCCGESGGSLYFFDMRWQKAHFDQYQYIVLEGDVSVAIVNIIRDRHYVHQRLTIGYSTSDLSAVGVDEMKFRQCSSLPLNQREGCGDYEQNSGEISFDIGQDSVSFQVRIVDDLCWEKHAEYIHLQLHIPGGVAIHGPGFRAHIKIDDDDWPGKSSTILNCTNKIS